MSIKLPEGREIYVDKSQKSLGDDAALPYRWMAPEAMTDAAYSSASDVFSYGVTVWEILNGGAIP